MESGQNTTELLLQILNTFNKMLDEQKSTNERLNNIEGLVAKVEKVSKEVQYELNRQMASRIK